MLAPRASAVTRDGAKGPARGAPRSPIARRDPSASAAPTASSPHATHAATCPSISGIRADGSLPSMKARIVASSGQLKEAVSHARRSASENADDVRGARDVAGRADGWRSRSQPQCRSRTMDTIKTNSGLKVKAGVKAGGLGTSNHSRGALKVRAGVKAGGLGTSNHSRGALKVRAGVKA